MSRTRVRDLPLFWKLLLPFLTLIIIFGALGAFLIVRDLAQRAQASLDQDLARRSFEARSLAHDRELYLAESTNFATGIQGMAGAIRARDAHAVERLLGSVLALKADVGLLVATGRDGVAIKELRQAGERSTAKPQIGAGTRWNQAFVMAALSDGAAGRHAGFVQDGARTFIAIAGPVCAAATGACDVVGAAIVGLPIDQLAKDAVGKVTPARGGETGGAAIFDQRGQLLAAAGMEGPPVSPFEGDRLLRRNARVRGRNVTTLYSPLEIQGQRVGMLAVTVPSDGAFAAVRGTAVSLGLIALAVMAGIVAVGAILSRFILAQLRPLVATNRALGRGDLTARAPVVSGDELGELARGVNQMAEQLAASYETLEMRVTQRTEEVRRLLSERTEFFAAVSHDLRTPLAVIRSQAIMMQDPKYADRNPAVTMKAIVESADQLLQLINELLELARAEAGRLEVDVRPVKIRDVLKEIRATIDGLAHAGDLRVRISIPRDIPRILADPRRLREILVNLVDNAVKYTPAGGTIDVTAAALNGSVTIEVSDSGVGIPVEDHEKIFEPFFRVKGNEPQRGQPSTGLGLALTKRLVKAQGGTVSLRSKPGSGTTITLTFPAVSESAPGRLVDSRATIVASSQSLQ